MKRMIGLLMLGGVMAGVVGFVGCGGDSDSPTGPTAGPQGQKLEIYNGVNEDDVAIEYQFYRNGNDMVQHGYYKEFWEEGRIRTSGFYSLGKEDYETPWKSYDWDGGEGPYWPRAILGGGMILRKHASDACSGMDDGPEQPHYKKSYDSISFRKDLGEGNDEDGKYWMCEQGGYSGYQVEGWDEWDDECMQSETGTKESCQISWADCRLDEDSGGGCDSYIPSYVAIDGKHYDAIRTEYDRLFLVCQDPQKCDDSSDALSGSVIFTDATYTLKKYGETEVYPKIDPLPEVSMGGIDWDAVPVTPYVEFD